VVLNDKIIGVTAAEVVGAAEAMALSVMRRAVGNYMVANGNRAPNPASPTAAACLTSVSNVLSPVPCQSDPARCYGRVPEDVLAPYLPAWFVANGWGRVMPYAVRADRVKLVAPECTTNFTLNGISIQWVAFGPGAARNTQIRPSSVLSNYLEDALNQDGWTAGAAGRSAFYSPTTGNDHLRSQ
jgi:hypothetical protein